MGRHSHFDCTLLAEKGFGFNVIEAVADVLVSTILTPTCVHAPAPSLFDAIQKAPLGIRDYARRLSRYLKCSEECFVVSLALLERILESNSDFAITDVNVHRLFLASATLAAKFQDDDFYSNPFYANIGGVTRDEMVDFEAKFLEMLDWRAHVSAEDYEHCLKRLGNGSIHLQQVQKVVCLPAPSSTATTREPTKEIVIDNNLTQQPSCGYVQCAGSDGQTLALECRTIPQLPLDDATWVDVEVDQAQSPVRPALTTIPKHCVPADAYAVQKVTSLAMDIQDEQPSVAMSPRREQLPDEENTAQQLAAEVFDQSSPIMRLQSCQMFPCLAGL